MFVMSDIGHTGHMPTITLTQGQRLRYAREAAGFTQEELGQVLHVGKSVISNWEKDGNVRGAPYSALLVIAQQTGFPIDFLAPRELAFAAITGSDSDVATLGYLPPRPYDVRLFELGAAA